MNMPIAKLYTVMIIQSLASALHRMGIIWYPPVVTRRYVYGRWPVGTSSGPFVVERCIDRQILYSDILRALRLGQDGHTVR
jgi:hypothetical protein